jgi:hypothetical protein
MHKHYCPRELPCLLIFEHFPQALPISCLIQKVLVPYPAAGNAQAKTTSSNIKLITTQSQSDGTLSFTMLFPHISLSCARTFLLRTLNQCRSRTCPRMTICFMLDIPQAPQRIQLLPWSTDQSKGRNPWTLVPARPPASSNEETPSSSGERVFEISFAGTIQWYLGFITTNTRTRPVF